VVVLSAVGAAAVVVVAGAVVVAGSVAVCAAAVTGAIIATVSTIRIADPPGPSRYRADATEALATRLTAGRSIH
jgi:hypothetical protein